MHRIFIVIVQFILLVFAPVTSFASTSADLKQVLNDVAVWIPGAYDSAPQIAYERLSGLPQDGEHERQYRIFARIDAPHLGEYVFYSQTRAGGIDGPIIQQVVFLTEIDEKNQGMKFNGRRIKDAENYIDAEKHPEKWATIGPDPKFGGNCDFFWRRHGSLLKGTLNDGTCSMTSRNTNQKMTWHTEWVLGPSELWVLDNGYYDDGSLVTGRSDKSHLRLYKANQFSCTAKTVSGKISSPLTTRISLHDRGGLAKVRNAEGKMTPLFLELMNGPIVSADGNIHEQLRLSLYNREPTDGAQLEPTAQASTDGSAQQISLRYPLNDVTCARIDNE